MRILGLKNDGLDFTKILTLQTLVLDKCELMLLFEDFYEIY